MSAQHGQGVCKHAPNSLCQNICFFDIVSLVHVADTVSTHGGQVTQPCCTEGQGVLHGLDTLSHKVAQKDKVSCMTWTPCPTKWHRRTRCLHSTDSLMVDKSRNRAAPAEGQPGCLAWSGHLVPQLKCHRRKGFPAWFRPFCPGCPKWSVRGTTCIVLIPSPAAQQIDLPLGTRLPLVCIEVRTASGRGCCADQRLFA